MEILNLETLSFHPPQRQTMASLATDPSMKQQCVNGYSLTGPIQKFEKKMEDSISWPAPQT